MAIQISLKKGTVDPNSTSGITLAEPVFNTVNNTFWMGKGSGVAPIWIGAGVCGASGGIAAGITYQIPTLGAVKDYFTAVSSNFLGTTASYVASFNGGTGAVTFANYVSSFNGLTGALQGVSSWNGSTGAVTFTNYVASFNGNTGAVTGASLGANTFTGLNTFSVGISAAGATFGATVTIAGGTAWHSLNDGAGSGLDADLVRGVAGQRFVENLQTGILYGGIISVNAGNTATVDITAGAGIIVTPGASLVAMPAPVVTTVTWTAQTAVALPQIANYDETWISFNSSGVVTLRNTAWTDAQYASEIPIGAVYHVNRSSVNLVKNYPHVAYGQADQLDPFLRAFGPLKLSGHEISANGANLSVNRTSGTAYAIGRNYQTDPNNPNVVTDSGATPASVVWRFYKNGGTGYTTVINSAIDPNNYDNGTGTLASTVKWTIQRIFYLPNQTNTLGVYYGTIEYTALTDAQLGILTESFAESESTATQGIFLGYLLVKGSCTDLSDTDKAKFVQGGLFRNVSSGGGSGLVTTSIDDLSDVVITSAANDNLLRYSGGQWINSAISTLPLVASFNGLTGAVAGVASVNGSTGAIVGVGFTSGKLSQFASTTSAELAGIISDETGSGVLVFGTSPSITTALNTASASFNLLTTNATSLFIGSAATTGRLFGYTGVLTATQSVTVAGANTGVGVNKTVNIGTGSGLNGTVVVNVGQSPDEGSGTINLLSNTAVTGTLSTTGNITAPNIVNSFNGSTGAIQGVSAAVAGTGISVSGATGSVTITNTGVQSFNGLTGAVTGVTAGGANTFTALNTFSAGISAAGGVTFSGTFSGATGTFSKLLSASAGLSAGGNVVFNAVTAVFGASAANTTPITVYKDNSTDNPAVDDGFGNTSFDTPNNKVPLTLSFTEVYDPNTGLTASTPGSTMIRVRNQNQNTDNFTVTDSGNIVCGSIICSSITPTAFSGNLDIGVGNSVTLNGDGSLPAATVLSVYNTLTSTNALTLKGDGTFSQLGTTGSLQYGAASVLNDSYNLTTTSTGATTMVSFTKTAYRSFEFDVQGARGTTGPYQFTKIVAVHDGTTVTTTQLSNISTVGVTVGTYTVDISGTLVRLRVTPGATASTVFKAVVKAIPV